MNMNTTNQSFGAVDKNLTAVAKEANPFEDSIPTVVANKPGFMPGTTLAGKYVRSKLVESEKLTGGKRYLHVFQDGNGVKFGIWGSGSLNAVATNLSPGDYLEVTYVGQAKEALKPGQTPPHQFKYRGISAQGNALSFDWDNNQELAN